MVLVRDNDDDVIFIIEEEKKKHRCTFDPGRTRMLKTAILRNFNRHFRGFRHARSCQHACQHPHLHIVSSVGLLVRTFNSILHQHQHLPVH